MNSLNRDGDWEQEFILRYGHCGGDKKRELERQNIINFIRTLLEEAKASERKRCLEALPKIKKSDYCDIKSGWSSECPHCSWNNAIKESRRNIKAISAISNKK